MTKSERIGEFGRQAVPVAEIARSLGIRYQHARKVLLDAGLLPTSTRISRSDRVSKIPVTIEVKPQLLVGKLLSAGFALVSRWKLTENGEMVCDTTLPKKVGVYAFAKEGIVLYVGVATMGLSKRLYFYGKPGKSQRTSQRLNRAIKDELAAVPSIDIYAAFPGDHDWNGLPIHGSAGLEMGLIKKYSLPWNKRSAG